LAFVVGHHPCARSTSPPPFSLPLPSNTLLMHRVLIKNLY
jgi:hypothetical protein